MRGLVGVGFRMESGGEVILCRLDLREKVGGLVASMEAEQGIDGEGIASDTGILTCNSTSYEYF